MTQQDLGYFVGGHIAWVTNALLLAIYLALRAARVGRPEPFGTTALRGVSITCGSALFTDQVMLRFTQIAPTVELAVAYSVGQTLFVWWLVHMMESTDPSDATKPRAGP